MRLSRSGLLAAGGILLVVIAFFAGITIVALQEDDGDTTEEPLPDCIFIPVQDELVIYDAPASTAAPIANAPLADYYPVERITDAYVYITLADGTGGWAERVAGGVQGKCENLPIGE